MTVIERSFIIRRGRALGRGWCRGCGQEVRLVAPEEAAAICGVSVRTVYRWVEAGEAHYEEEDGAPRVCLASLAGAAASAGFELRIRV